MHPAGAFSSMKQAYHFHVPRRAESRLWFCRQRTCMWLSLVGVEFERTRVRRSFHAETKQHEGAVGVEAKNELQPRSFLSHIALSPILKGVSLAINSSDDIIRRASNCFESGLKHVNLQSMQHWAETSSSLFSNQDDDVRHVANLAVTISYLLSKSRAQENVAAQDLDSCWSLISAALRSKSIRDHYKTVSRSAQGFLTVPLCSIIRDGNIQVLFRLHVWLPDGERGTAGFGIHSHQPFAQSWILAGSGTDHSYRVTPQQERTNASHAIYSLAWTSGTKLDQTYKTHQAFSKVCNTSKYVLTELSNSVSHSRDMSYSVPAAHFHSSEVAPDRLHATLFAFDASQGFVQDAPVLGPRDEESSTQIREAAGQSPTSLAVLVDAVRDWEDGTARAQSHEEKEEWHGVLEELTNLQSLCESQMDRRDMVWYKTSTLSKFSSILQRSEHELDNLCQWRYQHGRALYSNGHHREAISQLSPTRGPFPVIALAKTGSHSSREGLRFLRDLEVDFGSRDEFGCSALDYAVMNQDRLSEDIILQGMKTQLHAEVESHLYRKAKEARVKKHFAEIFTGTLRRILRRGGSNVWDDVRTAYAGLLDSNEGQARTFDRLKFVRWKDFASLGRFPRSSEGYTHHYQDGCEGLFLLFLSYRWTNPDPWAQSPDTAEHTQYQRARAAVEQFLRANASVDSDRLSIWIDFACIDQDAPIPGVNALPLLLAQCNALLSLVDGEYHERAWCNVEVMMMQRLRASYGIHGQYEYATDESAKGVLGAAGDEGEIDLRAKLLRFEEDRPKILFLEQQTKLLYH